jgi:uncharacterized protein (TIGR02145 family)
MDKQNLVKQVEVAINDNNTNVITKNPLLVEQKHEPSFGTVNILGREHKTIIIGKQEWMAENLYCPEIGCHYDNDPENSKDGYGTLHTYYAIPAIQKLLPDGWRVPTDKEWDVLENYVGSNAGKKLKSKDGWIDGGNGTDDFGFRVLPAGHRYYDGSNFYHRGSNAHFWSSSANSSTYAWYRNFYYSYATVYRFSTNRSYGFSVRCVRDIN